MQIQGKVHITCDNWAPQKITSWNALDLPTHCHMMINEPEKYLSNFVVKYLQYHLLYTSDCMCVVLRYMKVCSVHMIPCYSVHTNS